MVAQFSVFEKRHTQTLLSVANGTKAHSINESGKGTKRKSARPNCNICVLGRATEKSVGKRWGNLRHKFVYFIVECNFSFGHTNASLVGDLQYNEMSIVAKQDILIGNKQQQQQQQKYKNRCVKIIPRQCVLHDFLLLCYTKMLRFKTINHVKMFETHMLLPRWDCVLEPTHAQVEFDVAYEAHGEAFSRIVISYVILKCFVARVFV